MEYVDDFTVLVAANTNNYRHAKRYDQFHPFCARRNSIAWIWMFSL